MFPTSVTFLTRFHPPVLPPTTLSNSFSVSCISPLNFVWLLHGRRNRKAAANFPIPASNEGMGCGRAWRALNRNAEC